MVFEFLVSYCTLNLNSTDDHEDIRTAVLHKCFYECLNKMYYYWIYIIVISIFQDITLDHENSNTHDYHRVSPLTLLGRRAHPQN